MKKRALNVRPEINVDTRLEERRRDQAHGGIIAQPLPDAA